jgi:hypothetical protein
MKDLSVSTESILKIVYGIGILAVVVLAMLGQR